jgi:hypothetical protein
MPGKQPLPFCMFVLWRQQKENHHLPKDSREKEAL